MSVQPQRRDQLVRAAILEIGTTGSLDVTVGSIAKRAGVSPALAFHYFGDKDQLLLAAMRHILTIYGDEVRAALKRASSPRARLEAVIGTNFSPMNFRQEVISAWLNFYVMAQRSGPAFRLLNIYHRRLHSNLVHELKALGVSDAGAIATRIAGLIDGLYLRNAINPRDTTSRSALAHVLAALEKEIGEFQ